MEKPQCQVCGEGMDLSGQEARPAVYCADCSTPHHKDCFTYGGRCATYGCGGLRYAKKGPRARDVAEIHVGGQRPGKPPRPTQRRMILDLDTPLELAGTVATVLLFAAATIAFFILVDPKRRGAPPFGYEVPCWLSLGAFAALAMRMSTDCYYVIDEAAREVFYHRRFLGMARLYPLAFFRAVTAVELVCQRKWRGATKARPGHFYTEFRLEMIDGRDERWCVADIAESAHLPVDRELLNKGRDAAALIGCPFREQRIAYDPWKDTAGPAAIGAPAVAVLSAALLGVGSIFITLFYVLVMWPNISGLWAQDDPTGRPR